MTEEITYAMPTTLLKHIYLTLYNRQTYTKGGMIATDSTDYEVTYCLDEIDRIWSLQKELIRPKKQQQFVDISTCDNPNQVMPVE